MILTERFLLPPDIDDAQRHAIVRKRMRRRRGGSNGRVIAVFPGEDGWVPQAGNANGAVYFGVIERRFDPSSPRVSSRWKTW